MFIKTDTMTRLLYSTWKKTSKQVILICTCILRGMVIFKGCDKQIYIYIYIYIYNADSLIKLVLQYFNIVFLYLVWNELLWCNHLLFHWVCRMPSFPMYFCKQPAAFPSQMYTYNRARIEKVYTKGTIIYDIKPNSSILIYTCCFVFN